MKFPFLQRKRKTEKFCGVPADYIDYYNCRYTEPLGETSHRGKNNLILSENISLSLNHRKVRRNANVLIFGGRSCEDAVRCFIEPNIAAADRSYVVVDRDGDLYDRYGSFLKYSGYELVRINTSDKLLKIPRLDGIGDRKTAVFITTCDRYEEMAFPLLEKAYEELCRYVQRSQDQDIKEGLRIHVEFFIIGFGNRRIKDFDTLFATTRKYNISTAVIVSSVLEFEIYGKDWEDIAGNADTILFFGNTDRETEIWVEKRQTKTINNITEFISHVNNADNGNPVYSADALKNLSEDECIIIMKSMPAFKDKKTGRQKSYRIDA